ncbi:MAG: MlaD family protein [Bacteroidales bacterium]|nr:MlaD family protein [Bacteroidales bacterium]
MMKKINKSPRELWVGLLGILALAMIYMLINFFKGVSIFNEGDKYYARFHDIGEIVKSSPVYINGYKVGNVSDITYDFKEVNNVYIEMSLDKRLQIPQGSYAMIVNKTLGSSTINLVMSQKEVFLQPGDTLYGTLNAGAIHEAGNMLPQITSLLPKVDSILVSLNNVLSNPALNNSVNNIEQLTIQMNRTTALLNNILSEDIPQATDKLIEIEDDLLQVSSQLSEVDYTKLMNSLEASISNIQQITASLNNGEGTAGMLLKDSTLYTRLNETCEAATMLLEDLRENPKKYVHFSVFGRKQ